MVHIFDYFLFGQVETYVPLRRDLELMFTALFLQKFAPIAEATDWSRCQQQNEAKHCSISLKLTTKSKVHYVG